MDITNQEYFTEEVKRNSLVLVYITPTEKINETKLFIFLNYIRLNYIYYITFIMTDDNDFKLKNQIINDYSLLKDLYDKLVLENKGLKERLSKYTNPDRKKAYYQRNREKIIKQNSEYQKVYKSKNKTI